MDWSKHKTDLADAYGAAMVKDGQAAAICAVADRAVELARIKPSGQVAEDVEMVRSALGAFYGKAEPHKALDRLAALASDTAASREATAKAWAEAEVLRARAKEVELRWKEHGCEELQRERDAASAEVERLKAQLEQAKNGWAYEQRERRTAESRLAAIRERARNTEEIRKQYAEARASHCTPEAAALSVAMWVWEKDGLHMPVTAPCETQAAGQVANWVASLEEFLGDGTDRGLSAGNTREALRGLAGLAGEAESLRASAAVLESHNNTYEKAVDTLTRRVEELNAKVADMEGAYSELESDCSQIQEAMNAIRERARDRKALLDRAMDGLLQTVRWVMEGDERKEYVGPGPEDMMEGDAPQKEKVVPACVCSFDNRVPCFATRHACSPTCTHDDAATPGHPERMRERSEAVKVIGKSGEEQDAVEDNGRHPENDGDTFVAIENGVEGTMPMTRSQLERYAERKAEAMRVACWEIIQTELRLHGWGPGDGPWTRLKAAIEGAAP